MSACDSELAEETPRPILTLQLLRDVISRRGIRSGINTELVAKFLGRIVLGGGNVGWGGLWGTEPPSDTAMLAAMAKVGGNQD